MARTIYLSAGEHSGDTHAASLAAALRAAQPDVQLTGMGGPALAAVGVCCVHKPVVVNGLIEVAAHLPAIAQSLSRCEAYILETRPDVVVLVDYPGFHLRLAKRIKQRRPSQRIDYYICPKFWAWNRRRLAQIRRTVDHVLTILPFESPLLSAASVPNRFVGNPLLDQLTLDESGDALRNDLALSPDTPLVGLFPGSRPNELRRHLPLVLEAVGVLRRTQPEAAFVLAAAPEFAPSYCPDDRQAELAAIPVVYNRNQEIMAGAQVLLTKSGTTTLEAALFGTPLVTFYRTAPLTYWIARHLIRLRHVSLPNLLLCDFSETPLPVPPVPEYLQAAASPEALAAATARFLDNPDLCATVRDQLLSLHSLLGGPGASRRAAQAILAPLPTQ